MSTITKVFKNAIFVILLISAFTLVPQISAAYRDGNYINNEIVPLESEDYDLYIQKLASYFSFYYQEAPLLQETTYENENYKITVVIYSVSYYQENNIGDMMQVFIKDIKLKGKDFVEIRPKLKYTDNFTTEKNQFIDELSLSTIKPISQVKSFWAGDAYTTETSNNLNEMQAIKIYAIGEDSDDLIPLLSFSDDPLINSSFIFSDSLIDNNLVKDNYSLSSKISSSNNIPSELEIDQLGLVYNPFNYEDLLPYNGVITITFIIYSLGLAIVFYFFYVHFNLIKTLKEKKKLNK